MQQQEVPIVTQKSVHVRITEEIAAAIAAGRDRPQAQHLLADRPPTIVSADKARENLQSRAQSSGVCSGTD